MFYKNIEAETCEIFGIFYKNKPVVEILKRIEFCVENLYIQYMCFNSTL